MCMIAGDESHHHAYSEFVNRIFKLILAKWCLLFNTWWKKNRYASAFLERIRWKISTAFEQFSDSAQRIGLYRSRLCWLCRN
jgi:acyl-[acyl-carrier-protein] desaturase